jgi:hypothetical protein
MICGPVGFTGTRRASAPGVPLELGPLGRSPTSPQSPHPGRWCHPRTHHGFLGVRAKLHRRQCTRNLICGPRSSPKSRSRPQPQSPPRGRDHSSRHDGFFGDAERLWRCSVNLAQSWPRPSQCRSSWVSNGCRDGQPSSATLGTVHLMRQDRRPPRERRRAGPHAGCGEPKVGCLGRQSITSTAVYGAGAEPVQGLLA